jgi:hypothetical protein
MDHLTKENIDAMQPNWKAIAEANKAQKNTFELSEYRRTSDMEKFLYGFKKLCEQCNMHTVKYSTYSLYEHRIPILTSFDFDDGSNIGVIRLLEECGFDIKK